MASLPFAAASPTQLLTLGMFLFGMDTFAYSELQRRMSWRHENMDRHMARPASQFTGPGEDAILIAGLLVPEVAGSYGSIDTLIEMADTGDNWPLVDGYGRIYGHYRIERMDLAHRVVMAGGVPRAQDFAIELARVD